MDLKQQQRKPTKPKKKRKRTTSQRTVLDLNRNPEQQREKEGKINTFACAVVFAGPLRRHRHRRLVGGCLGVSTGVG
jgi:hypothetical protein